MTQTLPDFIQAFIKKYQELNLGGKTVTCPYYMNLQKKKDLRAMLGKGTPEEIEMEAHIWEKVKGVSFETMSANEIRDFLIARGIGIDCSGFVTHIINEWYTYENGKSVWRNIWTPRDSVLSWIKFILRPVEKMGADILTNQNNSYSIPLHEVRPGDVVRLKWKKRNSHHILLISEVERHEDGVLKEIRYVHSTPFYDENNGVKTGSITITDINQTLENQQWNEADKNGVNFTYEGYLVQLEDNGLRRMKVLEPFL